MTTAEHVAVVQLSPVPMGKKIAYAANQLGINLLWQAFNTVAVYFYVTQLKVPGVAISVGMTVYGFVNAFLNLIAGHISDRTQTSWGRRIPYVVIGSLPFAASFFFLFAPPRLGHQGLLIYFLVLTFLFDLFFTFTVLNTLALFPEMYPNERERGFVSALQQVFGIVGMILGVALAKGLGQSLGWQTMALVFAVLGGLSMYVSLYGSFENAALREQPFRLGEALAATFRNRRFVVFVTASFLIQFTTTLMTTLSTFYTTYVVALTPTQSMFFLGGTFIVAIPLSFVWARLADKMGSGKSVMVALVLYALTLMALLWDHSPMTTLVTGAVLGISVSAFMVLLPVLLADVIDYDAFLTGRRREGMYLGMNGFIVRLGLSLQYAVMAVFFSISGFNANAPVQTIKAVVYLRILIGGVPILFVMIAFLLLWRYVQYGARRNDVGF